MKEAHRIFVRCNGKFWAAVAGGSGAVLAARTLRREEDQVVNNSGASSPAPLAFGPMTATTHCEGGFHPLGTPSSLEVRTTDKPNTIRGQESGSGTGLDDYPNFTRHGSKAVLPKVLTPELYQQLKHLKTPKFGVTLEDLISAGTMLPYGADPPRGIGGVYCGDADCYRVFAPLLIPMIEGYHGVALEGEGGSREKSNITRRPSIFVRTSQISIGGRTAQKARRTRLQRHRTNLNPEQIVTTQLDPTGEYILYTRMRVARNLKGFAFASHISRKDRRKIEELFKSIVNEDFRPYQGGAYVPLHSMTNAQHDDYISRRMCFLDPDPFKLAANLGRDWPDARGIYCCRHWDPTKNRYTNEPKEPPLPVEEEIQMWEETQNLPNVVIWCNYDDHFWVISVNKGGNVQGIFTALSDAVRQLELSLLERDHTFCIDPKLGFLTSSPSNIGTALRASMSVKLVLLGKKHPALFQEILERLHLEAKSDYAETDQRYTGIFDIANAERLGRTEVQWINIMIQGVAKLIELEKKLEQGETVTIQDVDDVVKKVKSDR